MNLDVAIWIAVCVAKAAAIVAAGRQSNDANLRFLRYYFALSLACDLGLFGILHQFGLPSLQYEFAYYAFDFGLTVLGYFVIVRLLELAFEHSGRLTRLRAVALWLFTGVATCSAYIVYQLRGSFVAGRWCKELEQNFSFLGMVLALVLFVALNGLQIPGIRFRRVVLTFVVLYSSGAIAFTIMALFPASHWARLCAPMASLVSIALMVYALAAPEPDPAPARPLLRPVAMASQTPTALLPLLPTAELTLPQGGMLHSVLILAGSGLALLYSLFAYAHARILDADVAELGRLHREGLLAPNAGVVDDFRAMQRRLDELAPGLYMRQEMWLRAYYYALRLLRAGENRIAALDREFLRLSAYQAARYRAALASLAALKQ